MGLIKNCHTATSLFRLDLTLFTVRRSVIILHGQGSSRDVNHPYDGPRLS